MLSILSLDNTNAMRYYDNMIRTYGDKETEQIYKGKVSKKLPYEIQHIARRKLRMIDAAITVTDLKIPPGNRLEQLKGDLKAYWSIRINDKYRIIFIFKEGGAEDVKITDYH